MRQDKAEDAAELSRSKVNNAVLFKFCPETVADKPAVLQISYGKRMRLASGCAIMSLFQYKKQQITG